MISPQYLAGFLDGEGCILITAATNKRRWTLQVSVSQTELQILLDIQKEYKGTIHVMRHKSAKHSQAWRLVWGSKEALELLEKVFPYLQVKRPQAELVLTEWKPLIQKPGGSKGFRGSVPLTPENEAKRLEVKGKISSLNSTIN